MTPGLALAGLLLAAPAPAVAPVGGEACLECHEAKDAQVSGAHAGVACTACHAAARELPHPEDLPAVDCASCHADPDFQARHAIPFAHPVEAYRQSVHGRAAAAGNPRAPSCSTCHGTHAIVAGRDPHSPVHRSRVADTCGSCHPQARDAYRESVHGQARLHGVEDAPTCTGCHGEHAILAPSEPGSLVNPARVSTVTCGRCHGDERLAGRYNLPSDKVPSFADSYHGLALRSGSQTVANCASCHGVHDILPSRDPRSRVHPTRLAQTCGSCHPGAGQRFAIGAVHGAPGTAGEHAVVRFIRRLYLLLIPATIGFMLLHNALDFFAKLRRGPLPTHGAGELPRMNRNFRVAHALVVVSFPVLVLTGFALKYPEAWWASPLLGLEGRMAFRGVLHRGAGVVLVLALVYHAVHLICVPRDRSILRHLRPRWRDLRDLGAALLHNLGRGPRPRFGKFSYAEKAEYLAFVWGTLVMAVSGAILWFSGFSLRNLPKWVSDAATALHWYEAILATLAILVWHFYLVIFDPDVYPMDRAWLTGRASAAHLQATRPDYFEALARATKGPGEGKP